MTASRPLGLTDRLLINLGMKTKPEPTIWERFNHAFRGLRPVIKPDFLEFDEFIDITLLYDTGYQYLPLEEFISMMSDSTWINLIFKASDKKTWKSMMQTFRLILIKERKYAPLREIFPLFKLVNNAVNEKTMRNIRKFNRECTKEIRTHMTHNLNINFSPPRMHNAQHQMFSSFSGSAQAVSSAAFEVNKAAKAFTLTSESLTDSINDTLKPNFEKVGEMSDSVKSAADEISALKTQISELLERLQPKMESASETVGALEKIFNEAKTHIDGIVAQIVILQQSDSTAIQISAVTTILSLCGISQSVFCKIKDFFNSDIRQESDKKSTVMLLGLISGIMGKSSPLKSLTDSNMFTIMREAEAFDKVVDLFESVLNEWGIMESQSVKHAKLLKEDIALLFEELAGYETLYLRTPYKFAQDFHFKRFIKDYARLQEIRTNLIGERSTTNVYHEVLILIRHYDKLNIEIEAIRAGQARRCVPFAFCITGASGIGKTELLVDMVSNTPGGVQSLLSERFKQRLLDSDSRWDNVNIPDWTVWAENFSKDFKFQDGYVGNEIHIADDVFQNVDNNDHPAWINYVSSSRYLTNQADLKDKGRPYEARLCGITCNIFPRTSSVIKCITALQRRFFVIKAKPISAVPHGVQHNRDYSHLQFETWHSGVEFCANMPSKIMTMNQILDYILDSTLAKWEHHSSAMGFEQADGDDETWNWKSVTKQEINDVKNFKLMPYYYKDLTTDSGQYKDQALYVKFRRLKFSIKNDTVIPDGDYFLADLESKQQIWGDMEYIFKHFGMTTKLSRDRFLNSLTVPLKLYGKDLYLLDRAGGMIAPLDANDQERRQDDSSSDQYEDRRWFYQKWQDAGGFLKWLANLAFWTSFRYFTFMAQPTSYLIQFVSWLFNFSILDHFDACLFWLKVGTNVTSVIFIWSIMAGLNYIEQKIRLRSEMCEKCVIGKRVYDLIKLAQHESCLKVCAQGYIWNTHTAACKESEKEIMYIAKELCNCKGECKFCVHRYELEYDSRVPQVQKMLEEYGSHDRVRLLNKTFVLVSNYFKIARHEMSGSTCNICTYEEICREHSMDKTFIAQHMLRYGDSKYNPYFYKDGINKVILKGSERVPKSTNDEKLEEFLKGYRAEGDSGNSQQKSRVRYEGDSGNSQQKQRMRYEADTEPLPDSQIPDTVSETLKNPRQVLFEMRPEYSHLQMDGERIGIRTKLPSKEEYVNLEGRQLITTSIAGQGIVSPGVIQDHTRKLTKIELDEIIEDKERTEIDAELEMSSDPGAMDILRKLKQVQVKVKAKNVGMLHGLGYRHYVLSPYHIYVGEHHHYSCTRNINGVETEINLRLVASDKTHDVALFKFSSNYPPFPDSVMKYLPKRADLLRHIAASDGALLWMPASECTIICQLFLEGQVIMNTGVKKYEYEEVFRVSGLREDIGPPTKDGDCGGPLVLINSKLQNKLVGFHIMGSPKAGFSAVLSSELFKSLIEQDSSEIDADHEFKAYCDEMYSINTGCGLPVVDVLNLVPTMKIKPPYKGSGDIEYIGEVGFTSMPAMKTNLVKHPLNGVFPETMIPSALSESQVEDLSLLDTNDYGKPDILLTQFKKYDKQFTSLKPDQTEILEAMKRQLVEHISMVLENEDLSEMTEEEALSGVQDDPDSHPLDMRTSAGEPWSRIGPHAGMKKSKYCKVRIDEKTGEKRFTFNDQQYTQVLKETINIKEQFLPQGVRTMSLWKNCLKDETRPIEKVKTGKTRLFTAAPFESVYLFRKYFGKFKTAFQKHRTRLFHAVGINPVSAEWAELAKRLQTTGSQMFDMDFGNFDTNLRADFMRVVRDIISEVLMLHYKKTGNFSEAQLHSMFISFQVLLEECIETFHLSFSSVFLTKHGNPSGNPLTTVFNCLMNLLYWWYAFARITKILSLFKFLQYICIVVFGDDVVMSLKADCPVTVPQMVEILTEELGQKVTSGDKSTDNWNPKALSEIKFLCRRFVKYTGQIILAPLDEESIEQQFNWSQIAKSDTNAIRVQIEEAVIEAVAHGPTYFKQFTDILSKGIRQNKYLRNSLPMHFYYAENHQALLKRIDAAL